jgi:hypothetical protein
MGEYIGNVKRMVHQTIQGSLSNMQGSTIQSGPGLWSCVCLGYSRRRSVSRHLRRTSLLSRCVQLCASVLPAWLQWMPWIKSVKVQEHDPRLSRWTLSTNQVGVSTSGMPHRFLPVIELHLSWPQSQSLDTLVQARGYATDEHIISNIFQRTAGLSEPLWDAGVYGPFRSLSAARKGCAIFLSANSMTSVCLQCDM